MIAPLRYAFLPALLLGLSACASPAATSDEAPSDAPVDSAEHSADAASGSGDPTDYAVTFNGRQIDLRPYVQGFPYSRITPDLEQGHLLYFETTPEGTWMRTIDRLPEQGQVDLSAGVKLNDIDWSTRNYWGGEYNRTLEGLIFRGDERNDERINLYHLDLETGQVRALTDVDYIYAVGFSEDERLMAYVVRQGSEEPFNSCLRVRDLSTDQEQQIWCDEGGDDRLTWSAIEFDPANRHVVLTMQHDGDRRTTNLALFELPRPAEHDDQAVVAPRLLLERGTRHMRLGAIADTFDGERLLYISAESGQDALYTLDVATAESTLFTRLDHEISGLEIVQTSEAPLLFLLLEHPTGSILELRDLASGELLQSEKFEESVYVGDAFEGRLALSKSSVRTPFELDLITLERSGPVGRPIELKARRLAELPADLFEKLVHCKVEQVSIETFDNVESPDGPQLRTLHAYYFEPVHPPADADRLVRMTAFYGGGNYFSSANQIMCEAGVATLSPAVRGSSGFGADFAALNDGDLGGDEIVDLFFAARWLEANKGYQPHQIGVYGSSHGGYATMRALTFPPETNDHNDHYPFGFGLSHAGFSDIITFFTTSNIPDWVILEAGDPTTDAEKLRERSPLTHVERLKAPLLLTHGANDSRVPVAESRQFAEAASTTGAPLTYVEFEGQGHGISGLQNTLRYYRAVFSFLEGEVLGGGDSRGGEK
ncbi:S9 family peptidase [Bradymonadaceae bacterium TMQ3]|uniref:S9 family peptidase n=1 Tax=Lujinxingia sediminis TaxID=2480984 RepID=A0ABY0CP32_9DELT|nr:prolyl oligopeptidase family serine peptidase [Lujinxingia sediminis]RDV38113.1 S9 family peptidase [Bradymonadaceae bacterium TMQ3]RVU42217.1 S9 family peptidase [Lujinxingia sediminis]TXC75785.1 S9 family peptidase [Bradymonadales bacterium TMQ1]